MGKIRLGVIFGGRSGEHEISIRSAASVMEQIDRGRYDLVPIAITGDGNWLGPAEAISLLPDRTRKMLSSENSSQGEIIFPGDTKYGGALILSADRGHGEQLAIDVVFPVLHGTYGEDGTVQGLLEMSGIPYVGCGVLASSCGMDKVVMKTLFRDADLPQCNYVWFLRKEWEQNKDLVIDQIEAKLGYPCFVKPANLGSSVGVSRAADEGELRDAIALAAEFDRKIIVEESLDMREIECAVIGNDEPEASLPGEYVVHDSGKRFLDYTEKYSGTGNNEFVVPANLSEEETDRIREMAVTAYRSIDASGFARVDFFLRNDNQELLINEINTIPGLTDASGFPKMWVGSGVSFSEVLDRLVELAFERHQDRERNRTHR